MECAVLAVLFLFAALLGQVQYGLYGNFMAANSYAFARQAVFLLAAVLGTSAAVGTELIWPFFAVGGAAVLLPITERIAGPAYPLFFLASLLFFLLRSVHICLLRRRELHTQISSISIKEAIDSLDTVEMVMDLEEELGVELELEEKVSTVGELVDFVESKVE